MLTHPPGPARCPRVPRVPFGRGLARRNTHQRQPVIPAAEHALGPLDGWCGHLTGEGYAVMGNLLASEEVIATMAGVFEAAMEEPSRSASCVLWRPTRRPAGTSGGARAPWCTWCRASPTRTWTCRVDEHSDPVAELRRIYEVAKVELLPFMEALPTRKNPRGDLGEVIRGALIPD